MDNERYSKRSTHICKYKIKKKMGFNNLKQELKKKAEGKYISKQF